MDPDFATLAILSTSLALQVRYTKLSGSRRLRYVGTEGYAKARQDASAPSAVRPAHSIPEGTGKSKSSA